MPRRAEHLTLGAIAGSGLAFLRANNVGLTGNALLIETAGGLLGGLSGGIAPDWLEPATSPRHRDIAHSIVLLALTATAELAQVQADCRRRAAEARVRLGI